MAQSDLNIQNQLFPDARADINNAYQAVASHQKGSAPPPSPVTGSFWLDDDSPSATVWTLKMYDGTDWIEIMRFNTSANTIDLSNSVTLPPDYSTNITIEDNGSLTLDGGGVGVYIDNGPLYTDQINAVMANLDYTASLIIRNDGGTGDTGLAALMFHATDYKVKLGLRADGRVGFGGATADAWMWYLDAETGASVSAGDVTAFSDVRLKEALVPLVDHWSLLSGATPYRFRWKDRADVAQPGKLDIGFVAQEVQKFFPEAVVDTGDVMALAYAKYVVPLTAAVLELKGEIERLKAQIGG